MANWVEFIAGEVTLEESYCSRLDFVSGHAVRNNSVTSYSGHAELCQLEQRDLQKLETLCGMIENVSEASEGIATTRKEVRFLIKSVGCGAHMGLIKPMEEGLADGGCLVFL